MTLIATCLALFLGQVDTTAVNLALPAIRRDLAGGLAGSQWVVDAYNVTFAALLLTGGTLGAGLASGVANLARMFGATLGVAIQGTVFAIASAGAANGPHFVHGLRVAVAIGCTVEFIGAAVAFRYVHNSSARAA